MILFLRSFSLFSYVYLYFSIFIFIRYICILLAGRNTTTSKFCVRKHTDTCDAAQHISRLKFRNEDLLSGRNGSNVKDSIASPSSHVTIISPQKLVCSVTRLFGVYDSKYYTTTFQKWKAFADDCDGS